MKCQLSSGGAGGSRTRVQTRNQYAFYMLILLLIFEMGLVTGDRPQPYFLNLDKEPELLLIQPDLTSTTWSVSVRHAARVMSCPHS
jgi:hypothetical protein